MSAGLKGKRYINLLRCSTMLNDTSTADQKAVNDKFASQHGMIHIRDEELQGVSASKTFNRTDLKRLLAERKAYQNFDVLLVYDSSRLTRGGASHGNSVRSEFARAGVLVQSVVDPVPEGDFKHAQKVLDTMFPADKEGDFVWPEPSHEAGQS